MGDADPDVFEQFYRIDTEDEGLKELMSDPVLGNKIPQNILAASIIHA